MQQEATNYIRIERFSFFYKFYMFFDVADYLADDLFIKHKVKVAFLKEYRKDDTKYVSLFCRIRKRDEAAFCEALRELTDKMLAYGHSDYPDFCKQFMDCINEKPAERSYEGMTQYDGNRVKRSVTADRTTENGAAPSVSQSQDRQAISPKDARAKG